MESGLFNFADEDDDELSQSEYWNVVVADDSQDIHISTKFALSGVYINGKLINIIDTYSAEETKRLIDSRKDLHVLLLDAVMETQRAGIDCAIYIRNTLKQDLPIIVMRTGFAGWEIEKDPNSYKCIDDFVLKSQVTRNSLIDILEKWINHASEIEKAR